MAGNYPQAVAAANQALDLATKQYGEVHPQTAQIVSSLAYFQAGAGNASEAKSLFQRAAGIFDRLPAPDPLSQALCLCGYGQILFNQGNPAPAEPLFAKAAAILEKAFPAGHPQTATALNYLGLLYKDQGKFPEAEKAIRRSLQMREQAFGASSSQALASINSLALLYKVMEQFADAERYFVQALNIQEQSLGSESMHLVPAILNLALLHDSQDRYQAAVPLHLRAISIMEKLTATNSLPLAQEYKNLGLDYFFMGKMEEAEPFYQKALGIYRGNPSADPIDTADVLFTLGSFSQARAAYDRAVSQYEEARAIREKNLGPDHPELSSVLNNLAEALRDKGDLDKVEPLLRKALSMREKHLGPGHPQTAVVRNNLATLFVAQSRNREAESLFLTTLQELNKPGATQTRLLPTLLNNLAELYRNLGRFREAEESSRKAVDAAEARFGSATLEISVPLLGYGNSLQMNGKYGEAEKAYLRALSLKKRFQGPEHPGVAPILVNLSAIYEAWGRYAEAETCLTQALAIRKASLGEDHPAVGRLYCRMAGFYTGRYRYFMARSLFEKGIAILEKKLGPASGDLAGALHNFGDLYNTMNKPREAEGKLQKALEIRRTLFGENHPDVAATLHALGSVYLNEGNGPRAEEFLRRALALFERLLGSEHRELTGPLLNLSFVARDAGHPDEAIRHAARAKAILEKSRETKTEEYVQIIEALAYLKDLGSEWEAAWNLHIQALRGLEEIAASSGGERFARALRLTQREICTRLLDSFARRSSSGGGPPLLPSGTVRLEPHEASLSASEAPEAKSVQPGIASFQETLFQAMEMTRSREFLEQLARISPAQFSGVPPETLQREREFAASIVELSQKLSREARKPENRQNRELLSSLEQEISKRTLERNAFERHLEKEYPRYAMTRSPGTVSLRSFQRQTLRPGELTVSFWQSDEHLFAQIIDVSSSRILFQPIGSESLRLLVDQMNQAVGQTSGAAIFKAAGRSLTRRVFAPFFRDIDWKKIDTLFIIPSGEIARVPFEALLLSDTGGSFQTFDYLFRKTSMTYLPSATVLHFLRPNSGGPETATGKPGLLFFGDPLYSEHSASGTGSDLALNSGVLEFFNGSDTGDESGRGALLPPLPGTKDEIEALAGIASDSGFRHDLYSGENATESQVKKMSSNGTLRLYERIHFAVHGLLPLEAKGSSEPCLALSLVGDPGNDGLLKMSEIFGLTLHKGLVTLSACQTGKLGAMEHVFDTISGLARAFFHAGASQMTVTLWSVSDEGSSRFMKFYYENMLRENLPAAPALVKAKEQMLGTRFSHPFFWAPFILIGEK